jgi:hypothetical protein
MRGNRGIAAAHTASVGSALFAPIVHDQEATRHGETATNAPDKSTGTLAAIHLTKLFLQLLRKRKNNFRRCSPLFADSRAGMV